VTKVKTEFAGNSLPSRMLYRSVRNTLVLICRVYNRMTIEGRENIPATGPFVVAPIHRSYVDTPISCAVTTRRIRYMGKDSMWKHQPWRWMLTALGGFPVSRDTTDREALERSIGVLNSGEPLLIFPEGERKDGPIVQPLKRGAAYVAVKCGVPIIPVGIGGSDRMMPRKAKFVFPRKIHVIIGKPIQPPTSATPGRAAKNDVNALSDALHAELQRLYDAAQARC
jgi:1-acyl-sn-glycerol-3-phosphate acyltransferase